MKFFNALFMNIKVGLYDFEGFLLIIPHQGSKADYIGEHDGSEFTYRCIELSFRGGIPVQG